MHCKDGVSLQVAISKIALLQNGTYKREQGLRLKESLDWRAVSNNRVHEGHAWNESQRSL